MRPTQLQVLAELESYNLGLSLQEKMEIVELMFDTFERRIPTPKFRLEPKRQEWGVMAVDRYINTNTALHEGLEMAYSDEELEEINQI